MKRIFTLTLTLLVVVSPIIGVLPAAISGPVGSASAAGCGVDEYQNDTERYGTADALQGQTGYRVGADTYDFTCEDLQDDLSYYQAASTLRSSYWGFATTFDNSLEDSALSAYSELEKSVLYAYDNGTSLSSAKVEAKSSFDDYYSTKEMNYLENYEALVYGMDAFMNQSTYNLIDGFNGIGNVESDGSTFDLYNNDGYEASGDSYTDYAGLGTTQYTLANGTSVTVPTIKIEVYVDVKTLAGDGNSRWIFDQTVDLGPGLPTSPTISTEPENSDFKTGYLNLEFTNLVIQPPSGTDYPYQTFLFVGNVNDRLNQIESEYDNFNSTYEAYTEGIYNGLDTGEISYSDAISRATQVDTYLQQAADENRSFNMAVVGLSGAGLDGVAVENTSYMTVNMSTEKYDMPITRDGMLLSRGAPADGWAYNTTYDSANIDGGQMFVDLDGDEYTINGTFTIEGAYDENGDPINAESIQNPEPDRLETYDASDYVNLTQELQNDINELEEKLTDDDGAGGGGGGTDGASSSDILAGFADAMSALFGWAGAGISGAFQGLIIVVVGLVALSIVLNSLLP
ncbi:hypothetical protein [Halapricum desulfuricans]|uniref:Envelope protein N-terminal domain-containing protein n=1 Tax=Halapricum desulfuricans TaxID=2841257 RepID=A0A897MZ92_9EURY|nr:hypothetical protein [Halapricum desulfuricans]QSG05308.1 Uncharacterized protein HSR121_0960 [Halapricum desulfuricans]